MAEDMTIDATALIQELENDFVSAFKEALILHCHNWPTDDEAINLMEGFRQTLRLTTAGHLQFLESDPAYPLLTKMQSLQRQMQSPSADAVYHWSRIDGSYRYRLRGDRGSAHIIQIAVYEGSSSRYPDFRIVDTRDSLEDKGLEPNSELDIELSTDPNDTESIRLPAGEGELYVRQYYNDWQTEEPANLWIERIGATYPPPALDPDMLRKQASAVTSWIRVQSAVHRQYVESYLSSDPNKLKAISIPGAFEGTWYLNGHYRCSEDEAVILEVDEPDAPYWCFQLNNLQWEALDYYVRKTSINGHQAHIDQDGKFRAVISHRDPGVANWIDTCGRTLGIIAGRYFKSNSVAEPILKKVPFASLKEHLPEKTALTTESERQTELRNRLISAHRRFCSDQ